VLGDLGEVIPLTASDHRKIADVLDPRALGQGAPQTEADRTFVADSLAPALSPPSESADTARLDLAEEALRVALYNQPSVVAEEPIGKLAWSSWYRESARAIVDAAQQDTTP
jgi:hypothetical protein